VFVTFTNVDGGDVTYAEGSEGLPPPPPEEEEDEALVSVMMSERSEKTAFGSNESGRRIGDEKVGAC